MAEKIYLVGAGPGDPELLTRKAWRVLQSANVVLHDDLVPQELLRVLPPTTQVVNVGKRCGAKGISQAEINALMVQLAREGKIVARLKSGDPLLFGRAGEEMEALRAAEIEFEVIPGVTAALGAAASAQISLTDRRHASRVVFVTAHREGGTGLRNERHVAADTTYVIYMPGNRYAELAAELQTAGIVRRDFARDHEGRNDFPHDRRTVAGVPGSGFAVAARRGNRRGRRRKRERARRAVFEQAQRRSSAACSAASRP
jgi:uroporphyrin-III C-methyltransferase